MLKNDENEKLSELLRCWKGIVPSPALYERIKTRIPARKSIWENIRSIAFSKKTIFRFVEVVVIVTIVVLFYQLGKGPEIEILDDLAVVNLYLKQHEGVADQLISADQATKPIGQRTMSRRDILYYEFIDDYSKLRGPGLILRGPQSSAEDTSPAFPALSSGQTLTLSQAMETVDFDFIAPPQLHSRFSLQSIRKIEDFNCLQFLYSDGQTALSLFQQPADSVHALLAEDFREYAVFLNKSESGPDRKEDKQGTILAWSCGDIFFVLIGQEDLAHLMEIAQSVSELQEEAGAKNIN